MSCPAHFRTSAKEAVAISKTLRPFCWRRFASPTRSRYDRMSSFLPIFGLFRRKYSAISPDWNWIEKYFLRKRPKIGRKRSEEHTSELQSRFDLVCRLLPEKKK